MVARSCRRSSGTCLVQTSYYMPELNPIENVFSKVKAFLQAKDSWYLSTHSQCTIVLMAFCTDDCIVRHSGYMQSLIVLPVLFHMHFTCSSSSQLSHCINDSLPLFIIFFNAPISRNLTKSKLMVAPILAYSLSGFVGDSIYWSTQLVLFWGRRATVISTTWEWRKSRSTIRMMLVMLWML